MIFKCWFKYMWSRFYKFSISIFVNHFKKNVSKYLLITFASNSLNRNKSFFDCWPIYRVLYIQRPLLTWFFEDLNLTDIKNLNNTIKTSLQVMLVLKIWRVWLKNQTSCRFVFWIQNGRQLLNFGATKNFEYHK